MLLLCILLMKILKKLQIKANLYFGAVSILSSTVLDISLARVGLKCLKNNTP